MSKPYSGSALHHPRAKFIKKYQGGLKNQEPSFIQSIVALRESVLNDRIPDQARSLFDGRTSIIFDLGTITGSIVLDSLSIIHPSTTISFYLTDWQGNILRVTHVTIHENDTIVAIMRENPPDIRRQPATPRA